MQKLETSFVVSLPADIYSALISMAKVQGVHYGLAPFARELIEKGVPCEKFPDGPESHNLSIPVSRDQLNLIDEEAQKQNLTRSQYIRKILVNELNRFFENAVREGEVRRGKYPLLIRWSRFAGSIILLLAIGWNLNTWINLKSSHSKDEEILLNLRTSNEHIGEEERGLNRTLGNAFLKRGVYFFNQGEFNKALLDFKSSQQEDETKLVLTYLWKTYIQLGEKEKAQKVQRTLEAMR